MSPNESLKKVGIQELEEAFEAAFERAAARNYLESFEVVADDDEKGVRRVVVQVSQMASSPSPDQFKGNPELQRVEVALPHHPTTLFKLAGIQARNSFEYHASYYPG